MDRRCDHDDQNRDNCEQAVLPGLGIGSPQSNPWRCYTMRSDLPASSTLWLHQKVRRAGALSQGSLSVSPRPSGADGGPGEQVSPVPAGN